MSKVKSAATLLQRFPPRRNRVDVHSLLELCDDTFPNNDSKQSFLDELVCTVDMQIRPVPCLASKSSVRPDHFYFPTEYNRDGDAHRCVICNKWNTDGGESNEDSSHVVPSGYIRQLESIGNNVFTEYASQYYGRDVKCNVMVWSTSLDEAADVFPLGIAILIHRKTSAGDGDDANGFEGGTGTWSSTHVISVEREANTLHYTMHLTVYLDVDASSKTSSTAADGSTRFNGFLSQSSKQFTSTAQGKGANPDGESLLADIGEKVQSVENAVRSRIAETYFFQAGHIVSRLRTNNKNSAAAGGGGEQSPTSSAPSDFVHSSSTTASKKKKKPEIVQEAIAEEPAAETVAAEEPPTDEVEAPKKKKKKSKKSQVWEACQDDEGNTYYYNNETGETSWDAPAGQEEEGASTSSPQLGSDNASSPTSPEANGSALDVLTVLTSLNLSKDTPENYYSAIKKHLKHVHGVKCTVETLLNLDGEVMSVEDSTSGEVSTKAALEVLVPAFGDRKKITTWIKQQRSAS